MCCMAVSSGTLSMPCLLFCSAEIVQIWDQVSLDVRRQLALSKVIIVPCVSSHTLVA